MEFHEEFKFRNVEEHKLMQNWMDKFDVQIVDDKDAGMYGNRYVFWKSSILTNNKIVKGSGYNSMHGTYTRTFTSNDKQKD